MQTEERSVERTIASTVVVLQPGKKLPRLAIPRSEKPVCPRCGSIHVMRSAGLMRCPFCGHRAACE